MLVVVVGDFDVVVGSVEIGVGYGLGFGVVEFVGCISGFGSFVVEFIVLFCYLFVVLGCLFVSLLGGLGVFLFLVGFFVVRDWFFGCVGGFVEVSFLL